MPRCKEPKIPDAIVDQLEGRSKDRQGLSTGLGAVQTP